MMMMIKAAKGYGARKLTEFPNKTWTLPGVSYHNGMCCLRHRFWWNLQELIITMNRLYDYIFGKTETGTIRISEKIQIDVNW